MLDNSNAVSRFSLGEASAKKYSLVKQVFFPGRCILLIPVEINAIGEAHNDTAFVDAIKVSSLKAGAPLLHDVQRSLGEQLIIGVVHHPANDLSIVEIQHAGQVQPSFIGQYKRNIRYPLIIGPSQLEIAIQRSVIIKYNKCPLQR